MRHAYLIMAHNNQYVLESILEILDSSKNDFYIHIDKKSNQIDMKKLEETCKKSKVVLIKRRKIKWGDFSQVECELSLLEESIKEKYDYYHLISGVDMPIKSKKEIYEFFKRNEGKEFIHFAKKNEQKLYKERVNRYYLTKYLRDESFILRNINKIVNKIGVNIQRILRMERNKKISLYFGANWFSITQNMAEKINNEKKWIETHFKNTKCPDEHFLQSFIVNFKLEKNLYIKNSENSYLNCLRYIDWKRGNPYIWRMNNFDELMESDYLFARKFDSEVDAEIIKKIKIQLIKNFELK